VEDWGNDFLLDAYKGVKNEWGNESKKKDVATEFILVVGQNEG
jgi:hypothetical protein